MNRFLLFLAIAVLSGCGGGVLPEKLYDIYYENGDQKRTWPIYNKSDLDQLKSFLLDGIKSGEIVLTEDGEYPRLWARRVADMELGVELPVM